MTFRVLADVTVLLHLAFVVFVLLGGLLIFWHRTTAWAHLPAACWGAWVEFTGSVCPLTPLENWLRERGGRDAYSSSFIEHYLLPMLYPDSLSPELQWGLGSIVLLVNMIVYLVAFTRRRRAPPGGRRTRC